MSDEELDIERDDIVIGFYPKKTIEGVWMSKAEYNRMCAELEQAREALRQVQWVQTAVEDMEYCPWCIGWEHEGHAPDCPRQKALGL